MTLRLVNHTYEMQACLIVLKRLLLILKLHIAVAQLIADVDIDQRLIKYYFLFYFLLALFKLLNSLLYPTQFLKALAFVSLGFDIVIHTKLIFQVVSQYLEMSEKTKQAFQIFPQIIRVFPFTFNICRVQLLSSFDILCFFKRASRLSLKFRLALEFVSRNFKSLA